MKVEKQNEFLGTHHLASIMANSCPVGQILNTKRGKNLTIQYIGIMRLYQ